MSTDLAAGLQQKERILSGLQKGEASATGPIPAAARPQDGPQTGETLSKPSPGTDHCASSLGERSCQPGCHQSSRWRVPVGIAIELSDQQAQALSEPARCLHVSEAELVAAAMRDLVARQSIDFQAAADRVLNRNQELYRRLA